MIIEVKVPQLSESVAEATLLDWHKTEGEPVKRDENLIDIETDKVVLELPAPESGVLVEVKKPDGTVENWAFEAGTPNVLFRRGFTKDSLLPGTKIIIDGYQAKDGSRRANGRDITFPDGKKLFMGSSGTGAPYELTPGNQKK